jgi:hypothetical protein
MAELATKYLMRRQDYLISIKSFRGPYLSTEEVPNYFTNTTHIDVYCTHKLAGVS